MGSLEASLKADCLRQTPGPADASGNWRRSQHWWRRTLKHTLQIAVAAGLCRMGPRKVKPVRVGVRRQPVQQASRSAAPPVNNLGRELAGGRPRSAPTAPLIRGHCYRPDGAESIRRAPDRHFVTRPADRRLSTENAGRRLTNPTRLPAYGRRTAASHKRPA